MRAIKRRKIRKTSGNKNVTIGSPFITTIMLFVVALLSLLTIYESNLEQYYPVYYTATNIGAVKNAINATHSRTIEATTTNVNTAHTTTVNIRRNPPTVFFCTDLGNGIGEAISVFESALPEYEFVSIASPRQRKYRDTTKMDIDPSFGQRIVEEGRNNPWDFLLDYINGNKLSCEGSSWVKNNFTGNMLVVSGESIGEHYTLGPGKKFLIGPTSEVSDRTHTLTYLQMVWWQWYSRGRGSHKNFDSYEVARKLLDPAHRPSGKARKDFLIYAASNCVDFRNRAFVELSSIGEAFYAGKCQGTKEPSPNRTRVENKIGLRNWWDNVAFYGGYRFCLVMEHVKEQAYITEKILMAFLGGCIPIYYGSTNIFDMFDPNSFVYYDIQNPKPALDLVRRLEGNTTAYQEMLSRPILANGDETIAKYFSFSDALGGGFVKQQIRTKLKMDSYSFLNDSTSTL